MPLCPVGPGAPRTGLCPVCLCVPVAGAQSSEPRDCPFHPNLIPPAGQTDGQRHAPWFLCSCTLGSDHGGWAPAEGASQSDWAEGPPPKPMLCQGSKEHKSDAFSFLLVWGPPCHLPPPDKTDGFWLLGSASHGLPI